MYTHDGKYFTGEKTYWETESNAAGVVSKIVFAVKAWDNEGHKFQGALRPLTREEMDFVMRDTAAHYEFIEREIFSLYHSALAAEIVAKAAKSSEKGATNDGHTEGHSDSHIPQAGAE